MSKMTKKDIENIIPHRDPFLLIDEILEIEPGKWIKGVKHVKEQEYYFKGHFPQNPIMPGVLQIETIAQAGAVAVLILPENRGKLVLFAGIDKARFKRKVKPGDELYLKDKAKKDFCRAVVLEKKGEGRCRLKIERTPLFNTSQNENPTGSDKISSVETILDKIGFPPLPPYIKRDDDPAVAAIDKLRYQTVYACKAGAVAAPTAGLHFTNQLIEHLKYAGIRFAYITLHVGTGTFKPITAENLQDHQIHYLLMMYHLYIHFLHLL